MQARMKNPAMIIPGVMEALQALAKATEQGGVPKKTLDLVHLRASQINGCSVCVDMNFRFKAADETMERLFAVAAWQDVPYFTDAERAALSLTEAVTRLSDRSDPVPEEVWKRDSTMTRPRSPRYFSGLLRRMSGIGSMCPQSKWRGNGLNRTKQENGGESRSLRIERESRTIAMASDSGEAFRSE